MPDRRSHSLQRRTLAVIGLGQIGGSIVKRLAAKRACRQILVHDRDRRLADKVARYGEWVTDVNSAILDSDVVILAVPVPSIIEMLKHIATVTAKTSAKPLILDTGSVRQAIHAEAARHKSRFDHLGLHPLAGAEGEGWESSRADLFVNKPIVCTPPAKAHDPIARAIINALGATALPMDARVHDRLAAEAIGLPHLLAFAAQAIASANPLRAGSWASLTRVAASNPEMVAGFLSANAKEQMAVMARFESELRRLKRALADSSGKTLQRILTQLQRAEG